MTLIIAHTRPTNTISQRLKNLESWFCLSTIYYTSQKAEKQIFKIIVRNHLIRNPKLEIRYNLNVLSRGIRDLNRILIIILILI